MNPKANSTRKSAPTDDNKTDLNGWRHVGHYGSCLIYARDDKRRLVDVKTGQTTFEYKMSISDIEHGENIEELVVTRKVEGERNARL